MKKLLLIGLGIYIGNSITNRLWTMSILGGL